MFLAAILFPPPSRTPLSPIPPHASRRGNRQRRRLSRSRRKWENAQFGNATGQRGKLASAAFRVRRSIWALDPRKQPLLVIPTAQSSPRRVGIPRRRIVRVRWAEHTADFTIVAFFAEHLGPRSRIDLAQRDSPVLPVSRKTRRHRLMMPESCPQNLWISAVCVKYTLWPEAGKARRRSASPTKESPKMSSGGRP